ncbi:ASKHA domain-containing protein [Agathobacter sp.]
MQQKITVKLDNDYQTRQDQCFSTIFEYCKSNDIPLKNTPCGGKGTCGKCKVLVTKPYNKEVLACQTKVCDGMEFLIDDSSMSDEMVVLTEGASYDIAKAAGHTADMGTNDIDDTIGNCPDKNSINITLAACDIGTTTVVCYLIDKHTGDILSTRSAANPQRSFGADVLSRIEAACSKSDETSDVVENDNLGIMQSQIAGLLDNWITDMLAECGRSEVSFLSIAGNTTMCHLLMGLSPKKLGKAPFLPDEYFGKAFDPAEIGINKCQNMIIFPAVSGFVGGDITAGMMKTVNPNELTLFLDIGTNGEMALGCGDRYVCCATAAGPAFEGAEIEMGMPASKGAVDKVWLEGRRIKYTVIGDDRPVGICGSGLIDALAVLLQAGIIDENGTIQSGNELPILFRSYVFESQTQFAVHIAPGVYITQEDIRRLQLAKGAIAAGIDVLFREYHCSAEEIEALTFAGGFGNYINKASAAAIGIFPKELLDRTREVGNAAGNGAIAAALSKDAWDRAIALSRKMRYIELASYPGFDELYVEHMNFI